MHYIDDVDIVRRTLPGRWSVAATNFPMWTTGERHNPVYEYSVAKEKPLRLREVVSFTYTDGRSKTVVSSNRWHGNGFTWRGSRLRALMRGHWHVAAVSTDVLTLRYDRSLAMHPGVDLVVPEGRDTSNLRSEVAADPERFGLAIEEFASFTWLDHTPPAR